MSERSLEEMEAACWQPAEEPSAPDLYKFEMADDVDLENEEWLIKQLLPKVGVAFLAGPSGCGKSFLALELASRVAHGIPFLDNRTKQSGVLYIAAEGANGVRKRLKALRSKDGDWGPRFSFFGGVVPLASAEAVEKLSLSIRQSKITDIGLIVVDTFSASLPGCDENSGAEMSLVMTGLQRLSEAHQACVMVIAHTGKDFDRGVRGWSGMHANSDAVLFIEAPLPDGGRRGRVAKVKDGECSAFTFSLEKRELGTDGDGDLIETCVVQNLQVAEQTVSKRAPKKDADAEIIKAAFLKAPKVVVPADVTDGGVRGIQISALRAAAFTAGFGEEGRPLPDDDPVITTRWKDRRQKSWERAVKKLCSDSWLSRNQIWVWRTLSDDRPNPVLS